MKQLNTNLLLAIFITIISLFIVQSCQNENSEITTTENKSLDKIFEIPEFIYNSYVDGIKLPEGTRVNKIDDSSVEFIYPEGVELWISDATNGAAKIRYSSGGYTCTCSGSKGCNVFYAGGDFGCSHGKCTGACTGTKTKLVNKTDNIKYAFVNTNEKISLIQNEVDFDKLPYMPEMVLKQEKVKNILRDYAKSIYGENYKAITDKVDSYTSEKSDINSIVYVQMKMYGFKFIYGVSHKDLLPEILSKDSFGKVLYDIKSHSCKCDSGTSGCVKGSKLGVKYCKGGNCTSCTMTVK